MKKFLGLVLAASVLATASFADATKGQKIYLKKLKDACGVNGAEMASKHTQEEWEAVKDGLEGEIKALCPSVTGVPAEFLPDLYDFFHKYASDSGEVPAC